MLIHSNALTGVPPAHHQEAIAVERAQGTLTQVGRENVQLRLLGQLEEARIAVQILFVVVLQEARASQPAVREAEHSSQPTHGETQRKTANDSTAHIERHERQELSRRRIELAVRAVVAARGDTRSPGSRLLIKRDRSASRGVPFGDNLETGQPGT